MEISRLDFVVRKSIRRVTPMRLSHTEMHALCDASCFFEARTRDICFYAYIVIIIYENTHMSCYVTSSTHTRIKYNFNEYISACNHTNKHVACVSHMCEHIIHNTRLTRTNPHVWYNALHVHLMPCLQLHNTHSHIYIMYWCEVLYGAPTSFWVSSSKVLVGNLLPRPQLTKVCIATTVGISFSRVKKSILIRYVRATK